MVAKLLELGTSQRGGVILTLSKGLALNFGLMRAGKDSLGLLALCAETAKSSGINSNVEARLLLKVVDAKFDDFVVEVFTTQVSVTVGGLNFENTFIEAQEGHIKSATTEVENENIMLTNTSLLVKSVGDSGCSGLVDDALDDQT